jgi:outer membrane protein OmpA-like peptidoglycan-associated protein
MNRQSVMKIHANSRFALLAFLLCLLTAKPALSQVTQSYPYYVIIGAFAIRENAEKYTAQAVKLNLQATYKLNPNRKLYYVYVMSVDDQRKAMQEARRLRRLTKYKEAWIYNGPLGEAEMQSQSVSSDINPDTEKKIDVANQADRSTVAKDSSNVATDSVVADTTQPAKDSIESATEKNFVFELFRASNYEIVEGEVEAVDLERARRLGIYKGNTPVIIKKPSTARNEIAFISKVFGYRKEQQIVNFDNPITEKIVRDDNGNTVVPFELVRLQKGDIEVMYHVFFFKDAAVIQPESKYEVNSLLEMLRENPAYQIKIHGHTNGNAPGKIITPAENNFFSLTGGKEGIGSAKKLSEARAKVIRDYLISNGIAPERLKIKAWGGKRPIYDKLGPRAQENVRVEIEILEDK